jgi:hypothetical protein
MTKAATTEELASLHNQVSTSLKEDLDACKDIEDPAVRAAVRERTRAQAITFLKNNNITAAQGNDEMAALQRALAEKTKARKATTISPAALEEAAEIASARLQ